MVYLEEGKATCRVLDQHPFPEQKKISFLVDPNITTIAQFYSQVATQFSYERFDLTFEIKNV